MKQGKNNEIDLLLRSLARGDRAELPLDPGQPSARENQGLSDHLDADELNSFAEGLVPAPARARFISHLADCENCRGLVVSLTRASGAAARSEVLEQQTGAGFWRKMASLFSPPVLRYAVPAIALTAVIAISFLALRQQRRADSIAQIAQNQGTKSAARALSREQPAESPLAQSGIEAPSKTHSTGEPRERLDSFSDTKTLRDDRKSGAQAPATTTDADSRSSLALKSSAQPKQSYDAGVARPVFAPEPATTTPPPPKAAVKEADKAEVVQNEDFAKREVQRLPVEEEKNQPRDEAGRHGPSKNNNAIGGARRADGILTDSTESRAKRKKDSEDEGETRTVSGKRFRRQGNSWIDTAYESSPRSLINVSRGSEQFRALIADEPAIRTIAEKLSGIVIVVSNGRAYRIQ